MRASCHRRYLLNERWRHWWRSERFQCTESYQECQNRMMVLRLCKGTGGRGDHEVTLTETLTFPVCDSTILSVSCPRAMIRSASILLLFCFTASLLWCGDADCLTGMSNEDCASLICSLLNNHDSSRDNSLGTNAVDCSCICHLPALSTPVFDFSLSTNVLTSSFYSTFVVPSAPARLIYRPPIAA
jgi:hypothetical protein